MWALWGLDRGWDQGWACGQICFNSSRDIKACGPVDTLCLLSAPESGGRGGTGAERPTGEAGPALRWGGSAQGDVHPALPDGPQRARHPGCLQTPNQDQTQSSLTGHWSQLSSQSQVSRPSRRPRGGRSPSSLSGPHSTGLVSEERDLCPPQISARRLQCQGGLAAFPPVRFSLFLDVSLRVGAAL